VLGDDDLCKHGQNFTLKKRASHELLRDVVVENKHWKQFLNAQRCIIQTLKALLHCSVA